MDEGPLERMRKSRGMVVHSSREQRADQPMVEGDIRDRQEEWNPILVEKDDGEHYEEVEVRLDVSTGELHHDGRRDHQRNRRDGGPEAWREDAYGRHAAEARDHPAFEDDCQRIHMACQ